MDQNKTKMNESFLLPLVWATQASFQAAVTFQLLSPHSLCGD